jgi:hypothetical protein
MRTSYSILFRKPEDKETTMKDQSIDDRIILKLIWPVKMWTGFKKHKIIVQWQAVLNMVMNTEIARDLLTTWASILFSKRIIALFRWLVVRISDM